MEVQDLEKLVNQRSQSISSAMPALMRKVYTWMTLALAITGICAYGTATSPAILSMVYGNRVMPIVLIIATFGLVIYTSARIRKLSLSTATTLFVIYSALMGECSQASSSSIRRWSSPRPSLLLPAHSESWPSMAV